MTEIEGMSVSKGIAWGNVRRYISEEIPEWGNSTVRQVNNVQEEWKRYQGAKNQALGELERLCICIREESIKGTDSERFKIVAAHKAILDDPGMDEDILNKIRLEKEDAISAVNSVLNTYIGIMGQLDNDIMRERQADLRDVKRRILRCLSGKKEKMPERRTEPVILLARTLLPSEAASVSAVDVRGIITEEGSYKSHSAIIAREQNIPSVTGIHRCMERVREGDLVIVDAIKGKIVIDPDQETRDRYGINEDYGR